MSDAIKRPLADLLVGKWISDSSDDVGTIVDVSEFGGTEYIFVYYPDKGLIYPWDDLDDISIFDTKENAEKFAAIVE